MTSKIIFSKLPTASGHSFGVATLNAESSLNSLSLEMIELLAPMLLEWSKDDGIVGVVLNGAGDKAFCAGGDVRQLYHSIQQSGQGINRHVEEFFSREYELDYLIHTFPKPVVVWGNGIVMGGGIGLMAGASHRIVTETSRLAMPEITIGFYPDVGGTWFLRQMPGKVGLFLALTGANLNAADAVFCRLADYMITSDQYYSMVQAVKSTQWTGNPGQDNEILSGLLADVAGDPSDITAFTDSNVRDNLSIINELIGAANDIQSIAHRLIQVESDNPWLTRAIDTFRKGSPTSAAVSFELWKRGESINIADAFRLEYTVSLGFCAHPDFPEGVRALMIDKDRNPTWTPPLLDQVTDEWVAEHFLVRRSGAHPLADL